MPRGFTFSFLILFCFFNILLWVHVTFYKCEAQSLCLLVHRPSSLSSRWQPVAIHHVLGRHHHTMEGVRRKVTAKLAKGFNSKTREERLERRECVPWGGPVNKIAFLEYLSRGRGITLALLEPRDWNQDQRIKGSRMRKGENEDLAQEANILYDHTMNLRLPSCPTARSSLEVANELFC